MAACAHLLCSQGMSVNGLFIDFGQAAAEQEAKAVAALADHLGIAVRKAGPLGSRPSGPGELPGRNAFLIFTALFLSGGRPGLLGLGLHAGTPYYDCSEAFVAAMGQLVAEHTDGRVSVVAPFVTWTKRDVLIILFPRVCRSMLLTVAKPERSQPAARALPVATGEHSDVSETPSA